MVSYHAGLFLQVYQKNWLQTAWNINLDSLRTEVQTRQAEIEGITKYEELMEEAGFGEYTYDK